uniref:Uncharacterized protein n=1 Tax=Arundo donax TaxID=35708 RepID=A0A0A8Z0R1_ARUDO
MQFCCFNLNQVILSSNLSISTETLRG